MWVIVSTTALKWWPRLQFFTVWASMLVHFVTDDAAKIPAIRAMLEPRYHVAPQLLGMGDAQVHSNGVLMVDADLRKIDRVEQIRLVLQELSCISERLFVVHHQVRSMVAQAYALGATAVVSRPREIILKLAQIEVAEKAAQSDFATTSPEIADSVAAFASMFSAIRGGKLTNLLDAEHATSQIINSIAQNGLTAWLDDVRRYHEGTFQHCLLVTGVAVGFALDIGFTSLDVKRLGPRATLFFTGQN